MPSRCSSTRCRRSTKTAPMLSWSRTSAGVLEHAEDKILSTLDPRPEGCFINAGTSEEGPQLIWTVSLNHDWSTGLSINSNPSPHTPLVLLHGMGSGVGLWIANLPDLAADGRPVFAVDLLGFGRSSRPADLQNLDAEHTEERFVDFIENWRISMNLERMILLGHSFGGYLATAYSLRYPSRVSHLILADPWGFSRHLSEEELEARLPRRWRFVRYVYERVNPFGPLRAAGPMGPWVMLRIRPDLVSKFEPKLDRSAVANYLYHCNAQSPSGEVGFKSISHNIGWARYPMVDRINKLPDDLMITMIHGRHSWVDYKVAYEVQKLRPASSVKVRILEEAGHHVYIDADSEFNQIVVDACRRTDRSSRPSSKTSHSLKTANTENIHTAIPVV